MITISDEQALIFLSFADSLPKKIDARIELLKKKLLLREGITKPLLSIQSELESYFARTLTTFQTPIKLFGTDFQKNVWQNLMTIKHATTQSYADLAALSGNRKAVRAVAQANARNRVVIVIPCHRIIAKSGKLGGYSCGLERKIRLLEHEKNMIQKEM